MASYPSVSSTRRRENQQRMKLKEAACIVSYAAVLLMCKIVGVALYVPAERVFNCRRSITRSAGRSLTHNLGLFKQDQQQSGAAPRLPRSPHLSLTDDPERIIRLRAAFMSQYETIDSLCCYLCLRCAVKASRV